MPKQQPEAQAPSLANNQAPNLVPIKYIGTKEQKIDNVAGTELVWKTGEIHYVPPLMAQKLKRHPTVWQEAWDEAEQDPGSVGMVVQTTDETVLPPQKDGELLKALDLPNLQGMTKPDLATFARSQFNTELADTMKKDEMIQQIVSLSNSRASSEIE